MHCLRPLSFKPAAFLHFVFSDERELRRLLERAGAIAGVGFLLVLCTDEGAGWPDAASFFVGIAFYALVGALSGFGLTFILRWVYALWLYLYYRAKPRVKVWLKTWCQGVFLPAWRLYWNGSILGVTTWKLWFIAAFLLALGVYGSIMAAAEPPPASVSPGPRITEPLVSAPPATGPMPGYGGGLGMGPSSGRGLGRREGSP